MRFHADAVLPFERPRVFAAYRDRLLDLVPHLPNIRSITIESRKDREFSVTWRTDIHFVRSTP